MKEWNPPKDEQKEEQCLEAIEHELLLRELYYGFRILPLGVEPADLPGFKVANYDSTCEKGRAAITKTIRAELAAGIHTRTTARTEVLLLDLLKRREQDTTGRYRQRKVPNHH